jgi:phosphoribosylaminoimidazolecarboxamide formyltransferase / IMP cyclohydrolase
MPRIRRAILSCHDKTGLIEFAKVLRDFEVELVATEGTHRVLDKAAIPSLPIADFTGVREILSGRVKSLHPSIHAGLLGIRDNKIHAEELNTYNYKWIDLVVVNLHPIETMTADPRLSPEELMDLVDIGGIAMLRSAAKNFRYVAVVVNPERYATVAHELRAHDGDIPFQMRFRLAQEAFQVTAAYDRTLAHYLEGCEPPEE